MPSPFKCDYYGRHWKVNVLHHCDPPARWGKEESTTRSLFTIPFGVVLQALFSITNKQPPPQAKNPSLSSSQPNFGHVKNTVVQH